MIWLQLTNAYDGLPELIDVSDISRIGVARDPAQSILRFKSGRYAIYKERFADVKERIIKATIQERKE